jgi:hypothetical protein
LPDGASAIFLSEGLDRLLGDLPVVLLCRKPARLPSSFRVTQWHERPGRTAFYFCRALRFAATESNMLIIVGK